MEDHPIQPTPPAPKCPPAPSAPSPSAPQKAAYTPREEDCICKTDMRSSILGTDCVTQAQLYLNASGEYFIAFQTQQIYENRLSGEVDLAFYDDGIGQISESEAKYYMIKYFDPISLSVALNKEINELEKPRAKNTAYRISHRKPSRKSSRKRKYIVSHIAGSAI